MSSVLTGELFPEPATFGGLIPAKGFLFDRHADKSPTDGSIALRGLHTAAAGGRQTAVGSEELVLSAMGTS
jgi:hypothetical protein